jgi:hypothetical protein
MGLNPAIKSKIKLNLAMVECLLDGEAVELDHTVVVPDDDLIDAHRRAVTLQNLRRPEPEFHL